VEGTFLRGDGKSEPGMRMANCPDGQDWVKEAFESPRVYIQGSGDQEKDELCLGIE